MARSKSQSVPPGRGAPEPQSQPITPASIPSEPVQPSVALPHPPAAPPATPAPLAIVPPEPEAPPRGLEQVERADMVIPRIAILQAQPAQKLNVKPGGFLDRLSGELREALEGVVPLRFAKGRVWFEEMDQGGGVLCASDDRIRPAARIEEPVQPTCAGCPKSLWWRDGGKNTPPDCQETWTMLMLLDGMPYFITFKSGAMRATKKLLTQLTLMAKKDRRDACGYAFDISTELVQYAGGTSAFQPTFKNLRQTGKDDYALYRSMYDAFASVEPTFDDDGGAGAQPGADPAGQTDFPFGASVADAPGADAQG